MTRKISRTKVQSLIQETKGMYTVTFTKKNGEQRKMHARQNVEHNLKGGRNRVVKPDNDYITTFDVDAFDYRTINLATVTKLKIDGTKYTVV
jgi:hypothetical protein